MSNNVNDIKAQIYDEVVKHKVAERNIAILEQQLQDELKKDAQPAQPGLALAEKPEESIPHNNS